jgi:tetratricopeptide (TPR) repeat protein
MRQSRALVVAAVLAAMIGGVPSARAAPPGDPTAVATEALELYRAGKLEEAAERFETAFQLSGHPTQLRNAAKAWEQAGRLDRALERWGQYRALPGLSRDEVAEAEAHLGLIREREKAEAAMRAAEAARAAAEAATRDAARARAEAERARADAVRAAEVATADEPEASGSSIAAWVTGASGAAVLVSGAVLWSVQAGRLSRLDDALATTDGRGLIVGIGPTEAQDEIDAINGQRAISGVLIAAGATALVGGVVLALWPSDAPEVSVAPTPDGAAAHWRLRW